MRRMISLATLALLMLIAPLAASAQKIVDSSLVYPKFIKSGPFKTGHCKILIGHCWNAIHAAILKLPLIIFSILYGPYARQGLKTRLRTTFPIGSLIYWMRVQGVTEDFRGFMNGKRSAAPSEKGIGCKAAFQSATFHTMLRS